MHGDGDVLRRVADALRAFADAMEIIKKDRECGIFDAIPKSGATDGIVTAEPDISAPRRGDLPPKSRRSISLTIKAWARSRTSLEKRPRRATRKQAKRLRTFFAQRRWGRWSQVTREGIVESLMALGAAGSAKTVCTVLSGLNTLMKFAMEHGHIQANPCQGIARPKFPKRRKTKRTPRRLRDHEADALIAAARRDEESETPRFGRPRSYIYELARYTGGREGQLCMHDRPDGPGLRWRDCAHDDDVEPHLWFRDTKDGEDWRIPLHPRAVAVLKAWRARCDVAGPDDHVFPWRFHDRWFDGDLKAAGIPKHDPRTGRTASFQSLRRTYGTNLCLAGVPLVKAQKLMQHKCIEMTAEVYAEVADEELAEAVALLGYPQSDRKSAPAFAQVDAGEKPRYFVAAKSSEPVPTRQSELGQVDGPVRLRPSAWQLTAGAGAGLSTPPSSPSVPSRSESGARSTAPIAGAGFESAPVVVGDNSQDDAHGQDAPREDSPRVRDVRGDVHGAPVGSEPGTGQDVLGPVPTGVRRQDRAGHVQAPGGDQGPDGQGSRSGQRPDQARVAGSADDVPDVRANVQAGRRPRRLREEVGSALVVPLLPHAGALPEDCRPSGVAQEQDDGDEVLPGTDVRREPQGVHAAAGSKERPLHEMGTPPRPAPSATVGVRVPSHGLGRTGGEVHEEARGVTIPLRTPSPLAGAPSPVPTGAGGDFEAAAWKDTLNREGASADGPQSLRASSRHVRSSDAPEPVSSPARLEDHSPPAAVAPPPGDSGLSKSGLDGPERSGAKDGPLNVPPNWRPRFRNFPPAEVEHYARILIRVAQSQGMLPMAALDWAARILRRYWLIAVLASGLGTAAAAYGAWGRAEQPVRCADDWGRP